MNKRDREVFMIYDVHFKDLINIGILLSQCLLLDSQFWTTEEIRLSSFHEPVQIKYKNIEMNAT